MEIRTETYSDVSRRLDDACAWLQKLGVQFSKTRVGKYQAIWARLAALYQADSIELFLEEYTFSQWVNAATETSQILEIHEGLNHAASDELVGRLCTALRGHEMYVLDNDGRSGRDFSFELLVASRFGRSGYKVNFSSLADVEVEFDNFTLFVECKRLKSNQQVQKRIKEALKQLHRRYDVPPL